QWDGPEDRGRDRAPGARREQGDAGLIAERREVVHARQPDDLPPRKRGDVAIGVAVRGFPAPKPPAQGGLVFGRGLRDLLAKRNELSVAASGDHARRRQLGGLGPLVTHRGALCYRAGGAARGSPTYQNGEDDPSAVGPRL